MTGISYAITVKDELDEIMALFRAIAGHFRPSDEVVVLVDHRDKPSPVWAFVTQYTDVFTPRVYEADFEKDFDRKFADWKNHLNSKCTKKWIFNIDADEVPTPQLFQYLQYISDEDLNIDLVYIPRLNLVQDITPVHIRMWNWTVSDVGDYKNCINWPDYQARFYRNNPTKLFWEGDVHEGILGYTSYAMIDSSDYECRLNHFKHISKQEKQNLLYQQIAARQK